MAETKVQFDDFNDFMLATPAEPKTVDYVATTRLKDKDGNPKVWKLKSVSAKEDEAIRKSSTHKVKVPGRANVVREEMDSNVYMGRLAVACTVYPNLDNKALQDHYKVMSAEELLKEMLLPGEYADYCTKVSEINGFETSVGDLADEAKN